jgi:hypothetical protein
MKSKQKRRKDLKVREGGSKKVNECKQERGKQKWKVTKVEQRMPVQ